MEMYTVEQNGKLLKLKPCQLTTAVLAKLFCLFPESIVLVSDNGYVATPDEDGDFMNVDDLPIWTVTGESTKPSETLQTTSTNPYAYQPPRPGKGKVKEIKQMQSGRQPSLRLFSSVRSPLVFVPKNTKGHRKSQERRGRSSSGGSTLKSADGANMRGRRYVSNLPIQLTESDATVDRVSQMVSDDAFNGEPVALLDNDYLKILDTSSTRGETDYHLY